MLVFTLQRLEAVLLVEEKECVDTDDAHYRPNVNTNIIQWP